MSDLNIGDYALHAFGFPGPDIECVLVVDKTEDKLVLVSSTLEEPWTARIGRHRFIKITPEQAAERGCNYCGRITTEKVLCDEKAARYKAERERKEDA